MSRIGLAAVCLPVLVLGIAAELNDRPLPATDVLEPEKFAEVAPAALRPGEQFEIDIGLLREELRRMPADERPEQIADWAVWGTALHAGLTAESVRSALFDRPPVRVSFLSETFTFDYGPGRRLVVGDGEAWIFRRENEPHPEATVARLVDQVRMELGEPPRQVTIFAFRSDLMEGVLHVRTVERLAGAELFTPRFGWSEAVVRNPDDLARWLDRADDVAHARVVDDGVVLGGRRFDDDRTPAVSVEDVATLYRAHTVLADNRKRVEEELEEPVRQFNALVSELNDADGPAAWRFRDVKFLERVKALERLLAESADDTDLGLFALALKSREDAASFALDGLRQKVEAAMDPSSPWTRRVLTRHGGLPMEPGFSLDPLWNVPGLASDLRRFLTRPSDLVQLAYVPAREAIRAGKRGLTALHANAQALLMVKHLGRHRLPLAWRSRLEALARSLETIPADRREAEVDRALVPFFELQNEAKNSGTLQGFLLSTALRFVEARNRHQCARYDGPLQGTRVGMNLFYTDLLAKIWTIDYADSAPVEDVDGFLSGPDIGPSIEATYWDEVWARPGTRLWFGVRPEAHALTESEDALNFAPMATRVYSAGSNPINPGVEERPSEPSRRVFGWWDRHFARVADYEPQYHVQNQIMKWSVITGWLASSGAMTFLTSVELPSRSARRFQDWYAGEKGLRFRGNVHFVPRFGTSTTECVQILRSYNYAMAGKTAFTEGGVSLGSSRSVATGTKISSQIPMMVRRGGLARESTSEVLTSWKGTRFTLPSSPPARAPTPRLRESAWVVQPSANAAARVGGVELRIRRLENAVALRRGGGQVRIAADARAVGTLHVERTTRGVRLSWETDQLQLAHTQLEVIARAVEELERDGMGLDAARLGRAFGEPSRDLHLVETKTAEIVAIAQGSGGGVDHAAEALRLTVGGSDQPTAALHAATLTARTMPGRAMLTKVHGQFVARGRAMAEVEQAHWQKLAPIRPDGRPGRPELSRIFTYRDPPAGARPVEIRLSTGEVLDGRVADGALFLRRPTSQEASRRFVDLLDRENITPSYLEEVLAGAPDGGPPPLTARSPGIRAADRALAGEIAGALDELARPGRLDQMLSDFQAGVLRRGSARAFGGPARRARELFPERPVDATSADGMLLLALADIDRRDVKNAARAVHDALASPDAKRLGELAPFLDEAGPDGREIGAVLRARIGQIDGLSPEAARRVRLEPHGNTLQTAAHLIEDVPSPIASQVAKASLKAEAMQGRIAVYTERSPHLVNYDWDAMPAASLHRAMTDPEVEWVLVDAPSLGAFRPTRLVKANREFVRRELDAHSAVAPSITRTGRIVLLRSPSGSREEDPCDRNGDGQVDGQERRACGSN